MGVRKKLKKIECTLLLVSNRPRSLYQYSDMAPRQAFRTNIYIWVLLSLNSSLLWESRDKRNLKNLQFCPESLGFML